MIPKHSIISVFAIHNAFPTYDNLIFRGYYGPNFFILCRENEESIAHLFFSYKFSRTILSAIKKWVNLMHISCNYRQFLWVLRRHFRKNKWVHKFSCSAFSATIYYIWMERNYRILSQKFSTPWAIIRNIQFMTSIKMLAIPSDRQDIDRMDYIFS